MHTIGTPWQWGSFFALLLAMLAVDLGVVHRKEHRIGLREAARLELPVDGPGAAFQRLDLPPVRQQAGARVLHRVCHRALALLRQHLRLRRPLQLLRRPGQAPAPRPVLGHPGRAPVARPVHRPGHRPAQPLRMADARLRRLPRLHRDQDPARRGDGGPPGEEPGAPPVPAPRAADHRVPRQEVLRPPGRPHCWRRR